ncbi:MAG: hypothetical protein K2P86_04015 [Xanthobacteraceae bacterium]|jgi:hypothetical protein|nr:hypothetical protein [Xanthobacteraceae bacterium]
MREAFLAAAIAWGITAVVGAAGFVLNSSVPLVVTASFAILLSLLWLLHLLVFSLRATAGKDPIDGSVPAIVDTPSFPRRAFIGRFASVFVGAALATGFSRQVFAQSSQWYVCNTAFCGGKACCPTSDPILNHCTCRCFKASNEFSCGSYTQCNLDGSDCRG